MVGVENFAISTSPVRGEPSTFDIIRRAPAHGYDPCSTQFNRLPVAPASSTGIKRMDREGLAPSSFGCNPKALAAGRTIHKVAVTTELASARVPT